MTMRSVLNIFLRRLQEFGRSEKGMTLPLLAISMVMITGLVGLSIDVGRAQLVQSKLQFSLDAAGLAASSTASTADLTTEANKYLNANFNGYLGATVSNVSVVPNSTTTLITLTATATLPTTFMQVLGQSLITVTASSQITRQIAGLEVTLVIDVSYGDDLTDFKAGLNNFVNTLFTSAAGVSDNLYVSIVPFNQTVNIGTGSTTSTWINPTSDASILAANPVGWGPSGSWGGCIMARNATESVSDDPPGTGATLFNEWYFQSDTAASIATKLGVTTTVANADFQNYTGWMALNNKQQTDSEVSAAFANDFGLNIWQGKVQQGVSTVQKYASPLNTTAQGPNFMCPAQIAGLTNNQQTIINTINSISVIQGDWLPDMGLEWGWNTISPRWRGLWGGVAAANNLPLNYNTPGWNKAVVWVEGIAEASIPNGNVIDNHIPGGYGFLSQNILGSTNQITAINTILARAQTICNSLKSNNVYTYVLGYSANNSYNGLMPVMQNCATAQNYTFWFGPGDWTAFNTALNAIADSLVNLRVSQ